MQPTTNAQFKPGDTFSASTSQQLDVTSINKNKALERRQSQKRQFEEKSKQPENQNKQLKSTNSSLTTEQNYRIMQQKLKAFRNQLFKIEQQIQNQEMLVNKQRLQPCPVNLSDRTEQNRQNALLRRELCRRREEKKKILECLTSQAREIIDRFVPPFSRPPQLEWTLDKEKILQAYVNSLRPLSSNYKPTSSVERCPYRYYKISLSEALFREELSPLVRAMYNKKEEVNYKKFLRNMAAVRIKCNGVVLSTKASISNGGSTGMEGHSERLALCEAVDDAIARKLAPFENLPRLTTAIENNTCSLDTVALYKDALSKCEVDIFSDRTPCHDHNRRTDKYDRPYYITCEVFFAKILPTNSRIFFATSYLTGYEYGNSSQRMGGDLSSQYDTFSKIQRVPLVIQLLQPATANELPVANQVKSSSSLSKKTDSLEDEGIFKQTYLKDDEVIKELGEILSRLQILSRSQLQVSNMQSEGNTNLGHSIEKPIILPKPKEPVEEKVLKELRGAYSLGKSKFEALLSERELIATNVGGHNLDCYIYSLLQHVTGRYDILSFPKTLIEEIKEAADLSITPEMRYDDSLEALKIVKAINKKYQVNLEVYSVQINNEGHPIMPAPLFDVNNTNERQPIVLWLQVNHFVCITSCNLKLLIGEKSNTPYQAQTSSSCASTTTNLNFSSTTSSSQDSASFSQRITLTPKEIQVIMEEVGIYLQNQQGEVAERISYALSTANINQDNINTEVTKVVTQIYENLKLNRESPERLYLRQGIINNLSKMRLVERKNSLANSGNNREQEQAGEELKTATEVSHQETDSVSSSSALKRKGLSMQNDEDKRLFDDYSKQGMSVGDAVDNGDCFFDSVSQSLGGHPTCKELRELCANYIEEDAQKRPEGWVKSAMNQDATGGGAGYDECRKYIKYTASERDSAPTWGRANIEGRMICEKLKKSLYWTEYIRHTTCQLFYAESVPKNPPAVDAAKGVAIVIVKELDKFKAYFATQGGWVRDTATDQLKSICALKFDPSVQGISPECMPLEGDYRYNFDVFGHYQKTAKEIIDFAKQADILDKHIVATEYIRDRYVIKPGQVQKQSLEADFEESDAIHLIVKDNHFMPLLKTPSPRLHQSSSSSSTSTVTSKTASAASAQQISGSLSDNVEQCQARAFSPAGAALVYLQTIHSTSDAQTSAAQAEKQARVLEERPKPSPDPTLRKAPETPNRRVPPRSTPPPRVPPPKKK